MSERAIRKLQKKFILMSMGALMTTMLLVAGLLYVGTTVINRQVIHRTLQYIVDNDGELVRWNSNMSEKNMTAAEQIGQIMEQMFATNSDYQSQEFQFSTRYFAIEVAEDGEISNVKTNYIHAISDEEAIAYGKEALEKQVEFGRFDNFYYQIGSLENGGQIIVFLDSTSILKANQRLLYLALILIGFGMIVAFFLVRVMSKRAIRNEMKNAELQKQFMTNVSHELKTPLAVIRANTEMTEMLKGEDEWTESTMRQVARMDGLIKNLVMISRADENRMETITEEVDVSKAIAETVENFQGLAQGSEKTLRGDIEENVMMLADGAQIRQLCSLFVDNAIKYCDDGGEIVVEMKKKGKGIQLLISNAYAEGENVDYTKFFERFYREDTSHNVDKGGYGIGLSIAESIAKQYHGKVDVTWKQGIISFQCTLKQM